VLLGFALSVHGLEHSRGSGCVKSLTVIYAQVE
jgi:hypothetical protein